METPEKQNEFKEILRTKIDDTVDLIIQDGGFEENGQQLNIFLENNGQTLLNFSKFLSNVDNYNIPDIKIFETSHLGFVSNTKERFVGVPRYALEDPKEIFSILHEIGHVVSNHSTARNKEAVENQYHKNEWGLRYRKEALKNEREAWAYAIKAARKLKKQLNIDLFKLFKSTDEFMGWMRVDGLRTYENEIEQSGEKAYTKNGLVKQYRENIKTLNKEVEENYEN